MRHSPFTLSVLVSGLLYTQRKTLFLMVQVKIFLDGYSNCSRNSGLPGKTGH